MVNFWPTADLDEYINLQQKVEGRLVLLDVSATGEENVIESNPSKEMKDPEYRRKQLKKLQEYMLKSIAELIMRTIPYPMLLIFKLGDKRLFYVAHQRV